MLQAILSIKWTVLSYLYKNVYVYLIEPSAAVALASCLFGHVRPTVIVLTGRKVSYPTLRQLVSGKP